MITLNWPGGEHDFALRIGELRAIQNACDAGPEEVLNRFRVTAAWRVDDVIEVLRQGLIGGGMARQDATKLVMRVVETHGYLDIKMTCIAIMWDALAGPADDSSGKPTGEPESPPENGSSQHSTDPAQ